MRFRDFFVSETKLADILKPVPQSPKHHAEGDVFTHTRMVRSRLPIAIEFVKKEQQNNPNSVFKNLDMNLSANDIKILKLAAWFHDIGKASATKVDQETGKITAHGHESAKHYLPQIERLSGNLKNIYNSLSTVEKDILHFVIDNHMSLNQETGLPRKLWSAIYDDEGNIKNDTKSKLLIIFIIMDRTGRLKAVDFEPHITTFKHKQDASIQKADKEFADTLHPLHVSKEKHLQRLQNIRDHN